MKRDLHDFKRRLEMAVEKIKSKKEISENNKSKIFDFLSHCQIEGLSTGRACRYAWSMLAIGSWIAVDFDRAERKDIETLVGKIQMNEKYKDWTKHTFKVAIKKFFKWLNGGEEYPQCVRWIKCNFKNSDKLLPEELLTQEEVKRMVESAEHPRDKAFISALYESGCRIGEIGTLNIKNVVFDEYGAQITVDGKTGMRRVRLIASVPYLSAWINIHPFRNDPEASLWVSIGTLHHGKQMTYSSLRSLIRSVAEKAGVTKKVNPHRWRKSRATHLAPHLKEMVMDQYFGWILGSKMPRIYVHMSGRDVDDSLLEHYGMKKRDDKPQEALTPKICSMCRNINEATASFCNKCARPLEIKTMLELENKRVQDESLVLRLLQIPGISSQIIESGDEKILEELLRVHPNLVRELAPIVVKHRSGRL